MNCKFSIPWRATVICCYIKSGRVHVSAFGEDVCYRYLSWNYKNRGSPPTSHASNSELFLLSDHNLSLTFGQGRQRCRRRARTPGCVPCSHALIGSGEHPRAHFGGCVLGGWLSTSHTHAFVSILEATTLAFSCWFPVYFYRSLLKRYGGRLGLVVRSIPPGNRDREAKYDG